MSSFTFFALLSLLSSSLNFSDNPESRIVQIDDDDNAKYDKIKTNNVMMASSSSTYIVSPDNVLNIHLTGTWKNRFGSMLMIESADNGHIYGKYKLSSSSMKSLSLTKNVNTSAWYRIHGTYDSNQPTTTLAWSVSWAKADESSSSSSSNRVIKNTMAWCGRLANGGYMHLMLMMSNGDQSINEWESVSVTKDEFNKIKGESK